MNQDEVWLSGLCHQTDQLLWHAHERIGGNSSPETASRIHFPRYRARPDRRFSEQEARFAFAQVLASMVMPETHGDVVFAVENPTKRVYAISGSAGRSAATDLAIYRSARTDDPFVNIEFKSGGVTEGRKDRIHIKKDVAKLLAEPVTCGVWFHLVRRVNPATLDGIATTLDSAFQEMCRIKAGGDKKGLEEYTESPVVPKSLIVHFCVIEGHFSIQRKVDICSDGLNDSIVFPHNQVERCLPQTTEIPGWLFNRMSMSNSTTP